MSKFEDKRKAQAKTVRAAQGPTQNRQLARQNRKLLGKHYANKYHIRKG
jgi:hypothetical protein